MSAGALALTPGARLIYDGDLVEVMERLGHHCRNIVLVAVEVLDGIEHLLGYDVLVIRLGAVFPPQLELALCRVAKDF